MTTLYSFFLFFGGPLRNKRGLRKKATAGTRPINTTTAPPKNKRRVGGCDAFYKQATPTGLCIASLGAARKMTHSIFKIITRWDETASLSPDA
jgi:hypothetical protein